MTDSDKTCSSITEEGNAVFITLDVWQTFLCSKARQYLCFLRMLAPQMTLKR